MGHFPPFLAIERVEKPALNTRRRLFRQSHSRTADAFREETTGGADSVEALGRERSPVAPSCSKIPEVSECELVFATSAESNE